MPSRQQRPHSAHSSRKYYRTNNPKSPSSKLKVSLPTSSSGSSTFQEFVAVEEKLSTQRKQLPLRNVHVSLNTEYRRRPMSAHSRPSINNHTNHTNHNNHNNHNTNNNNNNSTQNENRRRRLQRLIQLSSGQQNLPSNQELSSSTWNNNSITGTNNKMNNSVSNYGGSHGRGVTLNELRKQFRAVRAYAMSGPDARQIRRRGLDPQKDVPHLDSYYTTVQVEGIPLQMGVPKLGLHGYTNNPGSDQQTGELFGGSGVMGGGTGAGISPWDDDGGWTPGRGPLLSQRHPFSPEAQQHQPQPQGQQQRPAISALKDTGKCSSNTKRTGPEIDVTGTHGRMTPRTLARKTRSRQSAPPPRLTPYTRLSSMSKTSSHDQLLDMQEKSYRSVHFKMGLNGKASKTFTRRPRTAGTTRQLQHAHANSSKKTRRKIQNQKHHRNAAAATATTATTATAATTRTTDQIDLHSSLTMATHTRNRKPRPMSASTAKQMGSRKRGVVLGETSTSNSTRKNRRPRIVVPHRDVHRGGGRLRGSSLKAKKTTSTKRTDVSRSNLTAVQTSTLDKHNNRSINLFNSAVNKRPSTAPSKRVVRTKKMNYTV